MQFIYAQLEQNFYRELNRFSWKNIDLNHILKVELFGFKTDDHISQDAWTKQDDTAKSKVA